MVDSERQYRRILGWVRTTQPEFVDRIELYSEATPLFEAHGVDAAIRSTLNRRVDLPSGGYLLFDFAEAFTVIDVNTGRFVGGGGRLEDTITRNNIEAAREVIRQLRLRDIGGIIVVDFIDMSSHKNRTEVLKVMQAELEKDRTKTYLVEISPLGLVEMTRQNVTEGVREILTRTCPTCGGEGVVLSEDTMAVEAERRLRKLARASSSEAFLIKVNSKVASLLVGPGGAKLLELERDTGKYYSLEPHSHLALDEIDVIADGSREEILAGKPTVKEDAMVRVKIAEPHMYNTTDALAYVDAYSVVIGGAIGYVGQDLRVKIDRVTRTMAFASLVDATPKMIELPVEPGGLELPEFDREIGERLELEQRPRRGRRTPAKPKAAAKPRAGSRSKAASAEGDADVIDAAAVAADGTEAEEKPKPKRTRTRKPKAATAAASDGDAATDTPQDDAPASSTADGDEAPRASRLRPSVAAAAAEAAAVAVVAAPPQRVRMVTAPLMPTPARSRRLTASRPKQSRPTTLRRLRMHRPSPRRPSGLRASGRRRASRRPPKRRRPPPTATGRERPPPPLRPKLRRLSRPRSRPSRRRPRRSRLNPPRPPVRKSGLLGKILGS